MGAKKTVQTQGEHEKALLQQGQRKSELGRQIAERPTQYVNQTATKDYSSLYRGRLNADAAQGLAGSNATAYNLAARGKGGLGALSRVDKASSKSLTAALSEGTKRGVVSRDKNIFSAADVSMGKQAGSSRNMSQLARMEANEIATQAKIAADETNALRSAATAVATAGLGEYRQGKMNTMRDKQMQDFRDYEARAKAAGDKPVSFADWSRGNSLEKQYGLGGWGKFGNYLGGAS